MYDPFEDAEKRGEVRGRASVLKLMQKLYALGREEDAKRAAID